MTYNATYRFLWRLCTAVIAFVLLMSSCTFRELDYDYNPFYEVDFEVDWSELTKAPSGMTIIFYPEDGGTPTSHSTNSVNKTKVGLRAGTYKAIIFNQSPYEFGSLGFRGMDRYETAEIYAQDVSSRAWYKAKSTDEKVAIEPEEIAVATFEGLVVSQEMIDVQREAIKSAKANPDSKSASQDLLATRSLISITPKKVTTIGYVDIYIKGVNNVRSIRGSVSGMSEGFKPSTFSTISSVVTHLLENWHTGRVEGGGENIDGLMTTSFSSFGLPITTLSRAGVVMTKGTETIQLVEPSQQSITTKADNNYQATLDISVLLVDNKTVIDYNFNIRDIIKIIEVNGNIVLSIEIQNLDPSDPNSDPITIPDVESEGGSGGFDASVDDWGEEQKIEIEL